MMLSECEDSGVKVLVEDNFQRRHKMVFHIKVDDFLLE